MGPIEIFIPSFHFSSLFSSNQIKDNESFLFPSLHFPQTKQSLRVKKVEVDIGISHVSNETSKGCYLRATTLLPKFSQIFVYLVYHLLFDC